MQIVVRPTHPIEANGYAATGSWPTNFRHDAASSFLTWLIRPSERWNFRAVLPVVSPVASFSAILRSRRLSVSSQAGKSILLAASSAGVQVWSGDQDLLPHLLLAVELVQSLQDETLLPSTVARRNVLAVQRAAEHAAVPGLGDGEPAQHAGVAQVELAQLSQPSDGSTGDADGVLDRFCPAFRIEVAERNPGVAADRGQEPQEGFVPGRCSRLRLGCNSYHGDDLQENGTAPQGGHGT